jgi:hypothetical protein
MTFRLEPELAGSLRQLPNQTAFVEEVLREALGRLCPVCHGTGQATGVHLTVSDFKGRHLPRLDRSAARELRAVVRLGRQLLATELEIEAAEDQDLGFRLAREDELLLKGSIPRGRVGGTEIKIAH